MPTDLLNSLPLVAILRGLAPTRAIEVGETLFSAGLRAIEVPLNSPQPFDSIRALSNRFGDTCLCGAGTVLSIDDVQRTFDAGGRLIVSPNCDPQVIAAALRLGMTALPGVATATEAFAAIGAGATRLKLFPAATYGSRHLKALKDVLPSNVGVMPVGGVGADDIAEWLKAGAAGFGFGSELFKPAYTREEIAERAQRVVAAYRAAAGPH
ncbi:MAG TPA: 2-dehydro-3-deoxy-6-phosphogalactonate aldolase [Povalibacter sp.]|uniref:2-dehydro-3-deoxy-6-phosphogalactonate aldolase n=1 Tax=Povalibacter sp. TaxID=1962978 RepID=UPI002C9224E0|nr:2-dehydro-3-deoxy-6-phosphogalactonate aldolase [Povalibacter sp.]HMN45386.1 2-dehydro-3-deoxy-6-phosphogalactonate aldolase [Povalibacter sp.]